MSARPDPIYRESALALEGMTSEDCGAWVQTLMDILTLPDTFPGDWR